MSSSDALASAIEGHRSRNSALRARFEALRVGLEEPCSVDFHFFAWTQRDAAVLARALYQKGFLIHLLAPSPCEADADRWSVEGGARIPLEQALSDKLTEELVKLAFDESAEFDGWGTDI